VAIAIYDSSGPATTEGSGQGRDDSRQPYHMTAAMDQVGTAALLCTGTVLAILGIFTGAFAADESGLTISCSSSLQTG
jgi:hypothetical protein